MDHYAPKLSHSDPLTDIRAARLLDPLRARRSRPRGMSPSWRPIETAPRDGTPVLVWVRWQNTPAGPAIAEWDLRRESWKRAGIARPIAPTIVTHWLPLPGSPSL